MSTIIFGMNMPLDGNVDHDAFAPGITLFQHFIELTRNFTGSDYGRGLYEVMRYWDGDDWNQGDPAQIAQLRKFAAVIRGLKTDLDGCIYVGGLNLRQA